MKKFKDFITEEPIDTGSSIGKDRSAMPQIQYNDIREFLQFLSEKGITVIKRKMQVSELLPTQDKVESDKVDEKTKDLLIKPFLVSRDNFILDSHHQLFALLKKDPEMLVDTYLINVNMKELLNIAKSFSKVSYKSL